MTGLTPTRTIHTRNGDTITLAHGHETRLIHLTISDGSAVLDESEAGELIDLLVAALRDLYRPTPDPYLEPDETLPPPLDGINDEGEDG